MSELKQGRRGAGREGPRTHPADASSEDIEDEPTQPRLAFWPEVVANDEGVRGEARRPSRGRGADGGRLERLTLRLTPAEKAQVEARAADRGLSAASYLRASALGGDPGPRSRSAGPKADAEALALAVAELRRTGNSLEQIVRALRAGGDVGGEEAAETYMLVGDAIRELVDIARGGRGS